MRNACGIVEVYGLVTAFVACDAGCKAADVTVENFDKNKPANADSMPVPLIVAIKFRGTVTNVEAAVEAAVAAAKRLTGLDPHSDQHRGRHRADAQTQRI